MPKIRPKRRSQDAKLDKQQALQDIQFDEVRSESRATLEQLRRETEAVRARVQQESQGFVDAAASELRGVEEKVAEQAGLFKEQQLRVEELLRAKMKELEARRHNSIISAPRPMQRALLTPQAIPGHATITAASARKSSPWAVVRGKPPEIRSKTLLAGPVRTTSTEKIWRCRIRMG